MKDSQTKLMTALGAHSQIPGGMTAEQLAGATGQSKDSVVKGLEALGETGNVSAVDTQDGERTYFVATPLEPEPAEEEAPAEEPLAVEEKSAKAKK
jgi:hypothetical protein